MDQQTATITSQEIYLQEIGKRLTAQDSLALFGEYTCPWWHAYEMHHVIAFYLEQLVQYLMTGEGIRNLMILTPPQHGKSAEASNIFPAWALGKLPDLRVLMCSYGADLASDNSREVRNIVLSDAYQAIFGKRSAIDEPVRLSADSRSVTRWDLAAPHRGGLVAAGVGGAFTGRARGLFILDDLFKDHRQAESQDYRNDVWDFLRSSVRPRALAKVLIMTHWHPDDCAGRYMRQMVTNPKADQWTILALPGFALEPAEYAQNMEEQRQKMLDGIYLPLQDPLEREAGEVLCPAMMSREEMLKVRESSEDFYFLSLYQQMPYTKEGQKYKRAWFRVIPKLPEGVKLIHLVRYWDKANSSAGDYTAGVLMAYGKDGNFYILDIVRGRWTSYERDQKIKKTAEADQQAWGKVYTWHQQDPGSAGKDSAVATNRLLVDFGGKFETVTGSKEDRSDPLESAFQGELINLLKGAWNEPYISESVAFNRGRYDDQVDAAASAFNKLQQMIRFAKKEPKSYQG
jgi:predicted phage terminase large subunit-like protein